MMVHSWLVMKKYQLITISHGYPNSPTLVHRGATVDNTATNSGKHGSLVVLHLFIFFMHHYVPIGWLTQYRFD